ncbi:hypothetical protein [Candidatus Babela massiliensis]|uniref:Uncharacterized protein n=1 Tax=Candidatus Babela massiliensis TaxID=673862 RepID=V6DF70_9BACT|nr:hypothetical protein [Candidatus Babela massiliensis]CDK30199.1 hypothetical protein BABL1_gene_893 [Candidatus Babela massiliensis]
MYKKYFDFINNKALQSFINILAALSLIVWGLILLIDTNNPIIYKADPLLDQIRLLIFVSSVTWIGIKIIKKNLL